LEQSEYLIVICSPDAAASKWVTLEIERFIALGRAHRILPILIAGKPFAEANGFGIEEECLPAPLRYDTSTPSPLFVDYRGDASRRREPFLRIVASLLELASLDQLIRRDSIARRQRRLLFAGGAAAALALVGLAAGGVVESEHNRSRILASAAQAAMDRNRSDLAIGYSLLSLPAPKGSIFDFSVPEARNVSIRAVYHNDLNLAAAGFESISDDGRYGLKIRRYFVDLFDLRANRRVGSYKWVDFNGSTRAFFSPNERYVIGPAEAGDGIMLVETGSAKEVSWPATSLNGGFAIAAAAPLAITNDDYNIANKTSIAIRALESDSKLF
jgi:hypothetical protein